MSEILVRGDNLPYDFWIKPDGREETPTDEAKQAVAELDAENSNPKAKASQRGGVETKIKNIVSENELTGRQRAFVELGRELGVPVVYFKGDKKFHGAHDGGKTYLNADSELSHGWTFWHETFHWMKNNNPELYKELVKEVSGADGFSKGQLDAYRKELGRQELTDAETIEEMLADKMPDVKERVSFLRDLGKRNKSLIERIVSWLRDVMDKFRDFMNKPTAGLTREQSNRMRDAFEKLAGSIVDADGNRIFKVYPISHTIKLANGRALPSMKFSATNDRELANESDHISPKESVKQKLLPLKGKPITNKATGTIAFIGSTGINEMISNRCVNKSLANNYTQAQHLEAVSNIKKLYEDAFLKSVEPDKKAKNPNEGLKSIKRFHCDTEVAGEKAEAKITVKESFRDGHRIYSLELLELNKPAELKNRAETDSSAGSKDSTHKGNVPGSHYAEESSNKSIPQTDDNGNNPKIRFSVNNNSSANLLQRIRNKVPVWLNSDKSESERPRKWITDKLKELTGYKIAYGHLTGKDAVFVDHIQKIIRSKGAYDWENLLPKIGEVVSRQLDMPQTDEMNNYIAGWFLDGALNNNSAEAKIFQKTMRDNPATFEIMHAIQSKFQEIANMTPMERTKSKIRDKAPDDSLMKRMFDGRAYEEWVDDLDPINQLVKQVEQRFGRKVPIVINPYERARLYKGTGGISEMMIEAEKADEVRAALKSAFPALNFDNFKTLASILENAGGKKNLKDFEAYCIAAQTKDLYKVNHEIENAQEKLRQEIQELKQNSPNNKKQIRAKERELEDLEQGKYPTVMSEADCDSILKNYSEKYGQAQKDLVNFSRTMLQMLCDSGVISQRAYNDMVSKWKNYVPMHRVFDDNESLNFGDSLKHRHGSQRDIDSPVQIIIRNAHELLKRAERNKVKLALAGLARSGAFKDLIDEVSDKDPADGTIITFLENGEKKYLQTDRAIVEAVNNLQTRNQGTWLTNVLTAATGVVRGLYTAFSPDFAAGNLFRDIPDAYLHNKYGKPDPFKTLAFIWDGLKSAWNKDSDFYEWLAMGGAQSTLVSPDRNYTQLSVDKLTKTNKERWFKSGVGGFFSQTLSALQTFSEYSEYATRIGVYKQAKGLLASKNSNGRATLADMKNAAMMSRDATIDFARGGKSGRAMNKYVAFSNAAIQGFDRTLRTFDYRKLKRFGGTAESERELFGAIVRLALTSIFPTIICFALNHDKDWWRNLPDYQRENNWLLWDGFKIPKGMDLGIRFTSKLTEGFLNWAVDNRPAELEKILPRQKDIVQNMIPTIALPLLENWFNESIFMERPIVPLREQKLPEYMQYDSYTSGLAKYIGERIDYSPRKIDHLISGYLGFLGKFALQTYDMTAGSKQLNLALENMPIARRFVFDPYKNPRIVSEYYEKYEEQEKLYNEYKMTKKKPADFDTALYERFKKNRQAMQNISKKERAIINDPRIDVDERRNRLHNLEQMRIKVCERVLR